MTGNPYIVSVRTPEILDKLEKHPIWQQRARRRSRGQRPGCLVGTGVACVTKDYGTGADCTLGPCGAWSGRQDHHLLRSRRDGQRHRHRAGQSGRDAISAPSPDEVSVARVDTYDVLGLVTSGDPYTMDQKTQDAAEKNPRWVPAISSATSRLDRRACRHPCGRRGRARHLPFRPVAGGAGAVGASGQAIPAPGIGRRRDGRTGSSSMPGLDAAAAAGNRRKSACAASASPGRWRTASPAGHGRGRAFRCLASSIAPRSTRWPCAGATASSNASTAPASSFRRPTTTGSAPPTPRCAARVVRVEIERATGALRIAKAYSVFECGQALVPEVVIGPGAGRLRHGRRLCAARDRCRPSRAGRATANGISGNTWSHADRTCRCTISKLRCCRRWTPNEAPKGMAEVVMIPMVPALLNAIFDATGHRFQSLPVTPACSRSSRRDHTDLTINGRTHGPTEVRDELSMNDFLREYLGMTGTKFGCGAAQCLSCAVIVDNPDGTSYTSPTCVALGGELQRQVHPHGRGPCEEMASCRRCRRPSSSTSRSSAATAPRASSTRARSCWSVWPKRRWRALISRTTIAEALDGHLCRCTGYIKYHEAVRDVILADPRRYLAANQG